MTADAPEETTDLFERDVEEYRDSARIYPLISDPGNRELLVNWLENAEEYTVVDDSVSIEDATFDLCIVDQQGLTENFEILKQRKEESQPVLLPYLLLMGDEGPAFLESELGQLPDTLVQDTVDEMLSLPVRQFELQWRIESLLRMRGQTQVLANRERELRQFRQAVRAAGHPIYVTDTDGVITYVNPEFEQLTGYPESDAIGETPELLNSGAMSDEYFDDLWETTRDGDVWTEEMTGEKKNGEQYYAQQTIAPIRGSDGDITGYVASLTDVTERKERELELHQKTRAIDEAPIGIVLTDPDQADNPLIYVNDAFTEMTGYSESAAVGRNCRFLQGKNTDAETVARIRDGVDAEEPVSVTLRNYRRDGSEFWNRLELAPVRNADGEVINYIGFQQDVTELRERQRHLETIDRVLRHNLNNDLNVVQGMAEQIQKEVSEPLTEYAQRIIDTGDALLETIDKERKITMLLEEEPLREDVELVAAVRAVADSVEKEYPSATVELSVSDQVVVGATSQIRTAIKELLKNAIEHNDSETPYAHVAVSETASGAVVRITDNGPRIPEMERAILLGEKEETPLYHGKGLGLWLVQLIVRRSNGTIEFTANEPRGSVVTIHLQAADTA